MQEIAQRFIVVTDALIVCPRCGYQYRALVKDGMMLSVSADAEEADGFFSEIRKLAYERERHRPRDRNPTSARQPVMTAR